MTDETKKARGRQPRFTDEFKAEAVRLVMTSGRPLSAIARDLRVGLSTFGKWVARTESPFAGRLAVAP